MHWSHAHETRPTSLYVHITVFKFIWQLSLKYFEALELKILEDK